MTNEEALERIDYARRNCDNDMDCDGQCDLCDEAMEMATQALEKQIPKKPVICVMEWISQPVEAQCPTCGEYVCKYDAWARATIKEHHCRCGQCIDWSDSNDN